MSDPVMKPKDIASFFRLLCLGFLALGALSQPAGAQDRIYRCGNEYTNDPGDAKARGCRVVEGGNVTVIQGIKPAPAAPARSTAPAAPTSGARNDNERVDAAAQRARDADARAILEAELRKAESRLSGLKQEYNNGEPEKRGPEFRNHQMYLDRVAELKAGVTRAQSDVDGIKRELARLAPAASAAR
jgi:predicted lipid-binding transport protein (Tim44 family)